MASLARGSRIMRGVCVALLVANVLLFVLMQRREPSLPATELLPTKLTRLALASEVPPRPRRCITLGPFRQQTELAAASNLLREVGYIPRSRPEAADMGTGYLVLVRNIRSTRQLDSAMGRLRRAGFNDAALAPDGTPGIQVSVGSFTDLAQAQQRATAVNRLGLKADVMERIIEGTATWLDIDLRASGEDLDPKDFGADGSLQVKPCPPAADRAAKPGPGEGL